jgi:photosystem II stability/assembly factor-like uncharacterized protein
MLTLGVPAAAKEGEVPTDSSRLTARTFAGLELRSLGPALMSGRIADIAVHPTDQSTWYIGVGSGGVWKTENAGTTWQPIFDDQGSYSIGCVTIDPNDPNVIWVGTGENVGGRHVGYGDGVYRSLDGGESWENLGLGRSEHIGKILVDPRDSRVVYVASQGPLWSPGGDRGLFKTVDGGRTWTKILGGGEYTGVNDVVMDPRNPDVLYASTHQRFRNVAALIDGGPESAIHKSTDGGKTWRRLGKSLEEKKKKRRSVPPGEEMPGLPHEDMGKIGLAISPQNPDVVYAAIELAHRKGGFWRSEDGGASWEERSDYVAGGTGPHYYQEIWASPHRFDRVYHADVRLHVTEDGGKTFQSINKPHKHVDNHALAFDPNDPDYILVGCDGGLYETWDLGENWKFISNLPVTQFYKVAVDYDEPFYNVYGGTQDNNTQGGPSRTDNVHGIRNADWRITLFGDGHQPAVDPTNPDIIYSEWQQGNLVRHDRKTGEIVYIQPQPGKDEPSERFNWDAPILISPHDPARLYYASQRVWRSDDRGDSWRPVSGDLSRGQDRLTLPMMGRVWSFDAVWDLLAMSQFATVTSLAESPLVEGLLYAGTDDGLIQVSEDGGASWRKIDHLPGVPELFFVNDLKADLHDADTVYAVVDNHKAGDFSPYLLKSTDRGRTWKSIVGDLPDRHILWRLVQDHEKADLLFVGTEFGVFFSIDGGGHWIKLTGGAPNIPFRDLVIQQRENDLVGATFGRGFYVFDDYTPLRSISQELLEDEAALFPVRKAWWYVPRRTLGRSEKASQGAAYFTAPNPPFGAVFTYYLKEDLKTRQKARREKEKEIEKMGGDTPYPGWEEIRAEELEEDPAILLTVRDQGGKVVRHLTGPVRAGFHRVAWDLRYPSPAPWKPADEREESWIPNLGFLAAPGTYTVSLAKRVEGVLTELGEPQAFEVVPMRTPTLAGASPAEAAAFLRQLADLKRSVEGAQSAIEEAAERLAAIKEVLVRSTVGDPSLDDEARRLESNLQGLKERLLGNERRRRLGDPGPVSISRRLQVVYYGNNWSTYGPTPTHRQSFDIASEEFTTLRVELDRLLREELPQLEDELDAAGVPWTPGRSSPSLR